MINEINQVVGLIGAPGAGKDTVADFFVKKGFTKFAIADEIKKGYYAESGYNETQFKTSRGTQLEQEIRKGLWEYSERKCKEFENPCYFMGLARRSISIVNSPTIISDIRTQMELIYFQTQIDAKIILVLRDYEKELACDILPGTKIKLSSIMDFPKFWNTSNSIEETYEKLERFYQNTIIGEKMELDSSIAEDPFKQT